MSVRERFVSQQHLEARNELRRTASRLAQAEERATSERRHRDDAVLDAYRLHVPVVGIAEAAGLSRRGVYDIIAYVARNGDGS